MTILSVAYPFASVGPDSVGGAEQVMSLIERAVARAGRRSLVLAARGSECAGSLIASSLPEGIIDTAARGRTTRAYGEMLERILEQEPVDVVHMHGVDFVSYLPQEGPAVLATLHLPISFYPPQIFSLRRERTFFNCVSASQARDCPESTVPISIVPNGIAIERFPFCEEKDDFVLALGRICPEKGFHLAIDAAKRAGLDLVLGGEVFPYREHRRYFDGEIGPRLDRKRRFVGPVRGRAKSLLLGRARCLVVPSLVAETSSLVAMEALACGTPVVATRAGALVEIVQEGVTGYLVDGIESMASALRQAIRLRPRDCRRAAEARFCADPMTKAYLDLYERML